MFIQVLMEIALLMLVSNQSGNTATPHEFLDGRLLMQIPAGYERYQSSDFEPNVQGFVRKGEWADALARKLPNKQFDESYLEDWFYDSIVAYVLIKTVVLTDQKNIDAHPREVFERFAGGFTERWGQYGFSFYEEDSGIGRCVNHAGAFVFVALRKIDNVLIIVEAMNNVEALVAEEGTFPDRSKPNQVETSWKYFREAANDGAVTSILSSARLVD